MKRILVINPNTSVHVTEMVVASCRLSQPHLLWDGVTGRLGAAYIASESAYAIAAHAVLDVYAAHFDGHAAVLIACFGDPGLLALRELAPAPVVGLAQASFEVAARRGPFAVVTGGKAWGPMLERFARMHQLDTRLVGVHTVDLNGAQIAAAPERALDDLFQACELARRSGAQSIVLGGAALAGLAATLQARVAIPLLDNVLLGAQAAVDAALLPPAPERPSGAARGPVTGLTAALTQLLR